MNSKGMTLQQIVVLIFFLAAFIVIMVVLNQFLCSTNMACVFK